MLIQTYQVIRDCAYSSLGGTRSAIFVTPYTGWLFGTGRFQINRSQLLIFNFSFHYRET